MGVVTVLDRRAVGGLGTGRAEQALHEGNRGTACPQVNMIVLDKDLGIPKPFGPQVEEVCCLETHVRSLLEPLGLCCTFVDDISAYHRFLGEVHCGTNVRRKPFAFKWWHMEP